ncbi:MAG: PAS domain S-box protein, partial [Geobacteraceae bacterium]|nr:PAS domain S-box protein [Geobacteraceae bacterium]
ARLLPLFARQLIVMVRNITRHRRTEEALRQVEERFRSIFRNISAGMFLLNPDGSFIEANAAFCTFLGYDCRELLKLNVMDITHPDDREGVLRRLHEARGGSRRTYNSGKRYLRKDGTTVWGQGTSNWFFDADGSPIYGVAVIQDITECRQAEEALRQSEAKFAKAFNATPTWLVISALEDGRFIEINEAFERICGYRREEVIGRASLELGIWAKPEQRVMIVQALRQGREVREWEVTFKGKEGKTFIGEVSAELIEVNGVQRLLTLVNDITGRKRAEEALRKWRDIFQHTRMGVVTGMRGSTTFDLVNPAYAEMHGCTVEELIGTSAFDLYPVELRGELQENVRLAHEKGHHVFETEHLRKDGSRFPVMVDITAVRDGKGESIYNIVNVQDITERKEMEQALRESEESFSKAFHATPTILVIATFAEGRYIEVNETFERILGYRRDEAIGRTSIEMNIWATPEDRARIVRMIREEGKVRDLEVNLRSKDGRIFVCLYSGELISIRGELCLLSMVNDITARKRMEERIEILNTDLASKAMELEAANRELEAFNYSVSHDLRSPLTGINGYCQLILDMHAGRLDEQCLGYVREIYGAGQQMDELITALLDFSQLLRCEIARETVDLSAIALMVANRLRTSGPQRRVTFAIAAGVTVEGDPKLLRLVIENLLGNAWKYSGKRDEARIEFGAVEMLSAECGVRNERLSNSELGKTAYFVRDNGAGFAMADADRLFTPFKRLHRSNEFEGHGIGLATVQRIIQRHGGSVWAVAEVGEGATFYFTLG